MASCNIISNYIDYSSKSTKALLKLVFDKKFDNDIYETFNEVYNQVRYKNELEDKCGSLLKNVDYYLCEKANELKKDYEKKYDNVVDYLTAYVAIFVMDTLNEYDLGLLSKNISNFRADYLLKDEIDFDKRFISLTNEIVENKNKFLEQFKSDSFYIRCYLTNEKKVYNTTLKHSLEFPKIYSDYAINKVFNSDIINEDKIMIEYNLVCARLLNDIIHGNFNTNYLVSFSPSFFDKENKINKLLTIIDNDIAKEKIAIKINYKDYINNKDKVSELITNGYNFAVILDDTYEHYENNKRIVTSLFKYVMINVNNKYYHYYENVKNLIKLKY